MINTTVKLATGRYGKRKHGQKLPCYPRPVKMSKERVYELVREIVLSEKLAIEGNDLSRAHYPSGFVTAEELANKTQTEIHKVTWALHQLNLRGLVKQRVRRFAHDTNRNPMFHGSESGWAANQYEIITRAPEYHGHVIPPRPTSWPEGTFPVWDEKEYVKKPRYSKRLRCRIHKPNASN